MAIDYFRCYHSYMRKCEKLTDQELGRLFRALLTYSSTGERQELAGRESIAFDFIADDIDSTAAASEAGRMARIEAGRKGGLAKASNAKQCQAVPSGARKNVAKPSKAIDATEREREGDSPLSPPFPSPSSLSPRPPITSTSPLPPYNPPFPEEKESAPLVPPVAPADVPEGVRESFREWLTYKRERRESYKPMGLKALEAQVRNNCAAYGARAVRELIQESMANGWKGIAWERLKTRPNVVPPEKETSNPFLAMLWEEEAKKNGQS